VIQLYSKIKIAKHKPLRFSFKRRGGGFSLSKELKIVALVKYNNLF
jgi:hypothetical protein